MAANGLKRPVPASSKQIKETGRVNWDPIDDEINLEEEVEWIPPRQPEPLDLQSLISWRQIGRKNSDYDIKSFASPLTMMELLNSKTDVHKASNEDRIVARLKSNPFETIRTGIFMNRAGMKMANLDSILNFSLTQPKTETGEPFVKPNELLYFADICAGPGGFSEYILWRKKWEAKGFGFTLKTKEHDFNLDNFISGQPESFEVFYGEEGDGDILKPTNVESFVELVLKTTGNQGVHFVMGDGGFEVDGAEQQQELLSKALVLAQCLVALSIVRVGGHFVCKMFDTFSPFSVGLIYIMYRSFDLVGIHKPNTSRPANSERYLICKWKRERTSNACSYLKECHELLYRFSTSDKDILHLVSMSILTEKGHPFYEYILKSNNSLAERQIKNLKKLKAFLMHPSLMEARQAETRAFCLEAWGIPDEKRNTQPDVEFPRARFETFKKTFDFSPGTLLLPENELTGATLEQSIKSIYDWRCLIVNGDQKCRNRGFYCGMGGTRVYRFQNNLWTDAPIKIELSRNTCVYGEYVHEVKENKKLVSFEIIDGFLLGGVDIRTHHYTLRHEMCSKFAKAMDKISHSDLPSMRVKSILRMESLPEVLTKIHQYSKNFSGDKNGSLKCPSDFENEHSSQFEPSGVLFIRITKEPWVMALSKKQNRKYWYHTEKHESQFELPDNAVADFEYSMKNRFIWWIDKSIFLNRSSSDPQNRVCTNRMTDFIRSLLPHTPSS